MWCYVLVCEIVCRKGGISGFIVVGSGSFWSC